jgi:hypothetical protein
MTCLISKSRRNPVLAILFKLLGDGRPGGQREGEEFEGIDGCDGDYECVRILVV